MRLNEMHLTIGFNQGMLDITFKGAEWKKGFYVADPKIFGTRKVIKTSHQDTNSLKPGPNM